MLDPHLDAVHVEVPAAAEFAVGQVLSPIILHLLIAHATGLARVQLHPLRVVLRWLLAVLGWSI